MSNLNKTEKIKNRFVSVDTDFIDMNNLNLGNLLNDMQNQNES